MGLLSCDVVFDHKFYGAEAGLIFNTRKEGLEHFLRIGEKLGLNPSPYFMWSWVKQQIAEQTLEQYLESAAQAAPPHPLFAPAKMRKILGRKKWQQHLSEWIKSSPLTELVPKAFLEESSGAKSPYAYFRSLAAANSQTPLESQFFSSQWYNSAYADVSESGLNPFLHYLMSGWKEGRDPSPRFSTVTYLLENDDVRKSGTNPLLHYSHFGQEEGRRAPATTHYELAVRYQSLSETSPPAYVPFEAPSDFSPEVLSFSHKINLVIVVPFYKREDLVASLFGSLLARSAELREIGALIVCINDSPDYPLLDEAICRWFGDIEKEEIDTIYLCNPENRGFVYSSNVGMWIANHIGAHCLLLNSDTIVMPGAITEMLSVLETDEKFGFVNPRTNNATIATYGGIPSSPEDGYAAFSRSHSLLPKHQIVPVAVGFCLLIRAEIIKFFGYLDSVYGVGYNEENDFIMRANRRGYSSVLANHSYVAHLGKASFSVFCESPEDLNRKNEEVFFARYPEFKPAINRYFASPKFLAQRLIEHDNDFDVILDLRCAIKARNGTTKLIGDLLPYLLGELQDLRLAIAADPEVMQFLDIKIPDHVATILDNSLKPKAGITFLFSQPFSLDIVSRMAFTCERIGFFMLDTIADDCLYIQRDGLHDLWHKVCSSGDLFVFNSSYTMARFTNRFTFKPEATLLASEHSLNPAEYVDPKTLPPRVARSGPPNVLIFGNHYEHKGLHPALNALIDQGFDLTVFGVALSRKDIPSFAAGQISEHKLSAIWDQCDVLVFPSFYEGFGFPIMEAVGRSKPIVLIDSELNRLLHTRLGQPQSFFFFNDFRELPEIVRVAGEFNGPWPDMDKLADDGWRRSAREIAEAIRRSLVVPLNYAKLEQRIFSFANATSGI
jgi:GT2 family glycosyltransferase